MKTFTIALLTLLFISSSLQSEDFAGYVNPFVGTGGHGHTYPGASLPFGMMQLSPDTRLSGWDGCSGYHYSDSIVYGFSHTHLSGTGCLDYGDILFMPTTREIQLSNKLYPSPFSHKNEKATAGFYSVLLDKYNINVELTTTKRAGFHKYEFKGNEQTGNLIIDLKHRDEVIDSKIEIVNDSLITGYRFSKSWATNQKIYFAVRFSKPIAKFIISANDTMIPGARSLQKKNIVAGLSFQLDGSKILLAKIGISAVSENGALMNLDAEIPMWNFEEIKSKAKLEWNKELGKIAVDGGSTEQRITFYSALYHSMLSPNLYMDVDGNYRGRDDKIHKAENFDYYTVFSLWDTYRAEHPLLTIIDQKRTNDFINTFIAQWEQGGLLPVWELSANETFCMIGYHSVPVIADAIIKGIRNFDLKKALKASLTSANKDHQGLAQYKKLVFIPSDTEPESVSRTLEYCFDDWCIAQIANILKDKTTYEEFIKRAQGYKNIFDTKTGFMRARFNGGWYVPFEPSEVNNNYTEANSWQYSFYVPQDISGFIKLIGGNDKFEKKVDELFNTTSKLSGREQSDITGLIGQYAHGNEPSHHIAYLYDYCGTPWKTQQIARKIMDELYHEKEDGLCGNEDCGQMSAWYVMSAMGFYAVCPGSKEYAVGTPLFDKLTLNLENGKKFVIKANAPSKTNFYIQSSKLNGKPYNKNFINHDDIMAGGELDFTLGQNPNKTKIEESYLPKTHITEFEPVLAPLILSEGKTIRKSLRVEIENLTVRANIYFTTDGRTPNINSAKYSGPFEISASTQIKAISEVHGKVSPETTANFFKLPEGVTVKIDSKYNNQYTAGGPEGLIDGIRASENFFQSGWQGYQGVDFSATVDFGRENHLGLAGAGFMQNTGSWILMPTEVEFLYSDDGKEFKSLGIIKNTVPDKEMTPTKKDFSIKTDVKARYLKVKAKNYGKLPEWHLGAGGDAFIFIDEIFFDKKEN